MSHRLATATFLFAACCIASVSADDWPHWRGPFNTGQAANGEYPTTWSADQNVAWKFALPGEAGSTPIVWKDRIFLTSPDEGQNALLCLNRQGELLWNKKIGSERPGKHQKASGSNPSPVTDGELVFAYYKSGDLGCFDFTGKLVWKTNLQEQFAEDTLWWDLGTSPVLTSDAVVVAVVQSGPSYLAAFDKETGKLLWKQDRMLDAPEEANQSYSTPIVVGVGENERILVLGADHVTAHSARNGQELWRVGGFNPDDHQYFRSIASAVIADDILIAPYARGDSLTAIRLGGSGDVTESHVLWRTAGTSSDVPTPAAYDGFVYVLTDKGMIACVDPATGRVVREVTLPRNRNAFSSSPVIAGGHLYAIREDGTCFVIELEDFEVVAENSIDEKMYATPVFVDGQILIRMYEHLYCIGKG